MKGRYYRAASLASLPVGMFKACLQKRALFPNINSEKVLQARTSKCRNKTRRTERIKQEGGIERNSTGVSHP